MRRHGARRVGLRRPRPRPNSLHPSPVFDLAYVAGTVGFFLLMAAYAAVCARLGASPGESDGDR